MRVGNNECSRATNNMVDEANMNWNVDLEVNLFHAMRKHKPVGVNRHFQMIFIHEKLNQAVNKNRITTKQIWSHLEKMYDLQALNESEIVPFPNKESEFSLSREEFAEIKSAEYPRMTECSKPEEPAPPKKSGGKASGVSQSTIDRISKTEDTEDSPKQRKRTRQSTQSPAPNASDRSDTPSSAKRARRT